MSLVNRHGLAVEAVSVELMAGFVSILGSHYDKGETIAHHVHRKNPANHAEKILDRGVLGAFGQISNQKLLCRRYGCGLHVYADIRIIIHSHRYVKHYFQVAAGPVDVALDADLD
jgi:hypothetical protein